MTIKFALQILPFFYCYLITTSSFSQEQCKCSKINSEAKFELLNEIDSTQLFKTTKLLKDSKIQSCIYEGLIIELQYYLSQKQLDEAFSILREIEKIVNESSCKQYYAFDFYYNKTLYYHFSNDLENLSDFAFKALKEAERLKDDSKQIIAIEEIVYLFTRMNEDDKNWEYIKRAEKLIENVKDVKKLVAHNRWLAFQYESRYVLLGRKTLLDSSLLFCNRAKKEAFKYQMFDEIAQTYRVQEAYAYHKAELALALVYIDSAIYYGKKIRGYKNLSGFYLAKTWDHFDLEQFDEANKWMDTALLYNTSDGAGKMMLYSEAAKIYEGAGRVDKAYNSFKIYSKMKDSILNIEKVEKINVLEQKYNKAKNEKTIFKLEKTKQLYTFLIIGSLLTILTIIFFFRQRALKNQQKIMETEQRLNRARINPHFFFNGMASLQNLSLQEKSSKTTLFISRFAKIMRQSLESTYEELTTVEEEIDFLTQYLEIQKLRYPEKFDYEFYIDKALEINELKLPGMLMQPFVENAIEHGFKDIDYKGKIDITFVDVNNQLLVIVEDNGKGLNFEENQKGYKSRAMQIIKDRLFLFNKQRHSNALYKVVSLKGGTGFKIEVTLPKLYS